MTYTSLIALVCRFVSVTDRFLLELSPVAQGQVPKDSDFKYENLVKGIRHVPIKVWVVLTICWVAYLFGLEGLAT